MEEDEEKADKADRGDFERDLLRHIAGDGRDNGDKGNRHLQCQAIKDQAIASRQAEPPLPLRTARRYLPSERIDLSIAPTALTDMMRGGQRLAKRGNL